MRKAVSEVQENPAYLGYKLLIDGNQDPFESRNSMTVVKGDAKSISIAAASIVAKVRRDQIMQQLADEYPMYGWEKNQGYATAEHIQAIQQSGSCLYHRKKFVRTVLANSQQLKIAV
jgi:ribonuclease HII